jgi:hypothetical protein
MRFPLDEPLNVQGAADAAASIIGRIDRAWRGPPVPAHRPLRSDCRPKRSPSYRTGTLDVWAGRRLAEREDSEPKAVGRWLTTLPPRRMTASRVPNWSSGTSVVLNRLAQPVAEHDHRVPGACFSRVAGAVQAR